MSAQIAKSAKLGINDVSKFLKVVKYVERTSQNHRRSIREVLDKFKPRNTTRDQLNRIAKFFFPAQSDISLERLFEKKDGYLYINPETYALARLLEIYASFGDGLREQFLRELCPEPAPVVRLGCPEIIGLRLLASALGDRTMALEGVELELRIENSNRLIPRLHAGSLDAVISYGQLDDVKSDPNYQISFVPLQHLAPIRLYCHPDEYLFLTNGTNINRDYWQQVFTKQNRGPGGATSHPVPAEKLRTVDLNDINFRNTSLIVVDSWHRPKRMESVISLVRSNGGIIRIAESYHEAIALVKMRLGFAFASELFPRREHVTVFRIEPEDCYQRWVGVYYNNRLGLSKAACQVVEFLRAYLSRFQPEMKQGKCPGYGDLEYKVWWSDLIKSPEWQNRDWNKYSQDQYPKFI
jgi:DNA-binding transcriptional LysR family regulator